MFRLLVLLVLVAWLVGLITSTTAGTLESLVGKENTLLATLAKAVLNGSTLALIEGVDQWLKVVEEEEDIQETRVLTKKQFLEETRKIENIPQEYVKYSRMYDMREIKKFLDLVRESGVTNMYQAAPYLYLGRERIAHEHHYDDMGEEREETFQELLDIAEDVRNVMIRGAFNHYDSKRSDEEGDEDDDDRRYLRGVEDIMRRDAQTLLKLWMSMKSGSRGMR